MSAHDPAPDLTAALKQSNMPFELTGVLGSGGMGVVYRARDVSNDRWLAIKTLHSLDSAALVRLKSEFRRAADVLHPNLVELHELVKVGEHWLLVMECIKGISLRDMLVIARRTPEALTMTIDSFGTAEGVGDPSVDQAERDRSFDVFSLEDINSVLDRAPPPSPNTDEVVALAPLLNPEELGRLFAQLAHGIGALHRHALLHRDIKPANVMVESTGRAVLLDFGLIQPRHRDGDLRPHELVGTPAYMAPEQVLMRKVGPAADWFAFGTVLFEALSGRFPFEGGSHRLLAAKRAGEPKKLLYGTGAPDELVDLANALCSRDPAARPGLDEVLAVLDPQGAAAGATSATTLGGDGFETGLVGRARELELVHEAWRQSRRDGPRGLHVHGPSGMGKSALVRNFLREIKVERGAVVLAGRCYQQERVPYKALDGVVDALAEDLKARPSGILLDWTPPHLPDLVRVFPALRQVSTLDVTPSPMPEQAVQQQEIRLRAVDGLRALLKRMGEYLPLVVVIDDAQWGDADSARLLDELLAPPDAPKLLLVVSYRSDEADRSEFLRARLGPGAASLRTIDVEVGPLSPVEAQTLAASILDVSVDDELAVRIAKEARFVPFFVEALARDAAHGGHTVGLAQVLADQVSGLPDDQRKVLQAVAVAGRPIPVALALEVADDGGLDARSTLRRLEVARLVRSSGDGVDAFVESYHDQIRVAADQSLDADALRLLHQRLARSWERRDDADPEALYRHYRGAGDDERAGGFAIEAAARASEALAFDAAADLYAQAQTLLGGRDDLTRLRADALVNAGRLADAAPLYVEAAGLETDSRAAAGLTRLAAEVYLQSGRYEQGLELLRPLLRKAGLGYPGSPQLALVGVIGRSIALGMRGTKFTERAVHDVDPRLLEKIDLCWAAGKGLGSVDVMRGGLYILRATQLALKAGEPERVSRGLGYVGLLMSSRGSDRDVRDGTRFLEQAKQIGVSANDPLLTGFADINHGTALMTLGEWEPSRLRLEAGVDLLEDRCTGVAWECGFGRAVLVCVLRNLGAQDDLWTRASRWLHDCEQAGDLYGAVWMRVYLAEALMAQGRCDEGRSELDRASQSIKAQIFTPQHLVGLVSESQIDRYEGRPDAALERLERHWKTAKRDFAMGWQTSQVVSHLSRATSHVHAAIDGLGDRGRHLAAAAADAKILAKIRRPYAQAASHLVRATAAHATGDLPGAEAAYALADAAYDQANMALYRAVVRQRRGELLGGESGQAMCDEAAQTFARERVSDPERFVQTHAPAPSAG